MNQLIPTSTDEQGNILVSGRDLHEFLEVGKDFSTWFKDMTNYGFEEGKDFTPISGKSNGGRPRTEYAMTLDMAKEISMIQRNDKGKQARRYFIEVEKEYKQNQIDVNELSPELKMFNQIFQTVAANELENKKLNHKVDNIAEIVSLNTTDWRKTSQALVRRIGTIQGGYGAYKEVPRDIYQETDRRAGSSLKTRLTNLRKTMALNGASKSKIDKTNKLDVIDQDKRIKEIYMAVVKDFAIKNKVWENEY
jgi:Phage anti-repressor protein